ncbi:MAG: alpha/beta fold hydrolase [Deltaproteobacteria bacterium]|nr:alpha/beta fold hydrolase [Deltaproteobacteria bacterium]
MCKLTFLIFVGALLAAGCDTGSPSDDPDAGGDAGNDAAGTDPDQGIDWEPCPLYVDQPAGLLAECATIDVPLRWSEPDGPTIGIFVQRLAAGTQPARGQLWLLEGGPGGSGADFDAFMDGFRALDPTLDLYAVDHRGVGRSARLSCPDEETGASDWSISVSPGEAAACLDAVEAVWGDDLDEFTATAAARDLGRLIEVAAEPGKDVFVYGVSYGTYWAHRYLQIHPDQATAVILDSIAPPGEDFVHYDADMDAAAQDFLALCAEDSLCSSKLGGDPWAAVGDLLATIEAGGHCPAITTTWGIDAPSARTVLAYLLMSPTTRTYLPAFVYRLARCDDADAVALDHLLDILFGTPETTYYDTLSSDALFYNVALSELWPDPEAHPTVGEIDAIEAGLYVTTGLSPRVAAVQDTWPAYPDDSYVEAWAKTATPLLMMNGDLDPMTPIWVGAEAAKHLTGERQWFYTIPRAAHCVVNQTPVAVQGDTPCGLRIMLDFLADPTTEPDTACLAEIPEEAFVGDPAINAYLLGTSDLWENGAAAPPALARPPAPLLRALREIRRLAGRAIAPS